MNQLAVVDVETGELQAPGQFTETALILPAGISFEQWQKTGSSLRRIEKAVLWWLGDWLNYGEREYGETYSQALEETEYSYDTLAQAKRVAAAIEPCSRLQNVPWSIHQEVAALPAEPRDELLRQAAAESLGKREVRERVRALKALPAPALPPDTYRVLYTDPPWKYSDELIASYGAAEHHYRTLSLDELCTLRDSAGRFVGELAGNNAVLFLWATSPLLDEALAIIAAWGFEYKTSFVWDKVKHNFGHYNSVRHELLLVCTRGSCTPDTPTLIDSVQVIERSDKHSEKPEEFRRIIDTLYPPPSARIDRVELFRRGAAPANWHVWGNEVDADGILQETA